MLKRSSSRLLTWRVDSFSIKRLFSALPIELLMPQLSEEMMKVKLLADEKHKSIGILKSSGDVLKQKISDLSAKREALLAELKQVEETLSQAQQEESQLPEAIKTLEQERNIQARKALQMKKKLQPVEGSIDEDMEIEEADQIRPRAISTIQALLNI